MEGKLHKIWEWFLWYLQWIIFRTMIESEKKTIWQSECNVKYTSVALTTNWLESWRTWKKNNENFKNYNDIKKNKTWFMNHKNNKWNLKINKKNKTLRNKNMWRITVDETTKNVIYEIANQHKKYAFAIRQ